MSIEITADFIKKAVNQKHPNSAVCVELANKIEVHAKGIMPEKIITKRRPSESEKVKDYRREIYVPITKKAIGKVINSLGKIRRSQDWKIQYDADSTPKNIATGETLQDYCEVNYPGFQSLTNWVFAEMLKRSLIDANAVCAVIVKSLPASATEYIKPEVEIFDSKQICNYVPGEYYCLQSTDVVAYNGANGRIYDGKVYYILTDTQVARIEQRGAAYVPTLIYDHNLGEVPVVKVGGVYFDRKNNDIIQESFIAEMSPYLDEAVREYSDLQAEIVQHVHSEKYIYTNTECPNCKGSGHVHGETDENGQPKVCHRCKGTGNIANISPYGEYTITAGRKMEEYQLPTPPIGYINKSTEIAKLQDERVRNHIYDALSTVNMEFLAETPLAQSGVAKEVDRDELNNFVYTVAESLIATLDRCYYFICHYRYSFIVPDKEKRNAMLPVIAVPERYDLLNSSVLVTEIQTAKAAKINPVLTKYMEIELAQKKYNADPEIAQEVETMLDLDPLYGYDQQEKMTMLANGGITERDYIVSCNIAQFIQRAFKEEREFIKKSFSEKRKIIDGYAAEITKANAAKSAIEIPTIEE
ncbi:MAG: hypothetical protein LBR64_02215 [Dysgonamonadaceae bacterium]|jgi:hypothetical protein|nr:hypothetical protein [Dysgonamonadaceae bacterium]